MKFSIILSFVSLFIKEINFFINDFMDLDFENFKIIFGLFDSIKSCIKSIFF